MRDSDASPIKSEFICTLLKLHQSIVCRYVLHKLVSALHRQCINIFFIEEAYLQYEMELASLRFSQTLSVALLPGVMLTLVTLKS